MGINQKAKLKIDLPVPLEHGAVKGLEIEVLSVDMLIPGSVSAQILWFKSNAGRCCAWYFEVELL